MRRAEREITESRECWEVLDAAPVLYLAFHDKPSPYVIPVTFGVEEGRIWVHGAPSGAKITLLRANPRVGFSAHCGFSIVTAVAACDFSVRARSVVGWGKARIVEKEAERLRGLDLILRHYSNAAGVYRPVALSRTSVIAIEVETIRAKRFG
jgi:nitroimidazol reductase NimA-like FMN-containing flavoprotein (pyridoxamine 5'-phosphate oxidase superfamily)